MTFPANELSALSQRCGVGDLGFRGARGLGEADNVWDLSFNIGFRVRDSCYFRKKTLNPKP